MRLWHKKLISVLPRQQLLSQWRELCAIASNLAKNGTPNHILVNKILDYDISHLANYASLVVKEFDKRNYTISEKSAKMFYSNLKQFQKNIKLKLTPISFSKIYKNWHNKKYFIQCFHNLEEKYDCGGIDENDWINIKNLKESYIG